MTVDLVIPMLNEAANVEALFDALEPLVGDGAIRHVVVGDNGSTDGSPELVKNRGGVVVHEPQRGYGAACLKAIDWIARRQAAPEAIAFLDADLSDDPEALRDLVRALGDHDLAIGCRTRLAEPGALNTVQRFGGWIASVMMFLTTGKRYRDLGPMRAIRWEAYRRMRMSDRTWGWTVEMQTKAAMLNLRIVELDVPYRNRRAGQSKISGTVTGVIKAGWKITTTIWRVRLFWRADGP